MKFIISGYVLLLVLGGVFAFAVKGSAMSLLFSVLISLPLVMSVYMWDRQKNNAFYLAIGTGFGAMLLLSRLLMTHKFMPAGFLFILSALLVVVLTWNQLVRKSKFGA